MNTAQNTPAKSTSRFAGIRGLGRGIALGSVVAVMGLGSLSAAEASAAGIAHGVTYAGSATTNTAKPTPTDLATTRTTQLIIRDGKAHKA